LVSEADDQVIETPPAGDERALSTGPGWRCEGLHPIQGASATEPDRGVGQSAGTRLEQHQFLLDSERIALTKVIVPARSQGPGRTRPATLVDPVEI
jgi:hypothetical protein